MMVTSKLFEDNDENTRASLRLLSRLLYLMVIVIFFLILLLFHAFETIDISVPPDLSQGAILKRGHKEPTEIYSFAFNLFQQLQRWRTNGAQDYADNITRYRHYITPDYSRWLENDLLRRLDDNELNGRERYVEPISGFNYSESAVKKTSGDTWVVYLKLRLVETFNKRPVKEIDFNYPIRIVRIDKDRKDNPWRLALDGYESIPEKIKSPESK